MATVLLQNAAFSGSLAAFTSGRLQNDPDPTDYASTVAAANAFATQFLTANAALAVPMTDADNASIGALVETICFGVLEGRAYSSTTAAFYAVTASAAAALAKQASASLVV